MSDLPHRSRVVCAGSLGRRAGHPDRAVIAAAPEITPTANGFVDLVSVPAVFRRKLHDRLMDFGRDTRCETFMNPLSASDVFCTVAIMSVTFLAEVGLFILIGML
ncbi:hypothetical protein [Bradyrhizobium vignae]|uniref:hypothetical protein n=1 Tax=Bradyrhizobium vignae TaxID=1549949 RepID=UPI0013E8D95F|nr:hypothetical protein [Bradyrhizobium vignae]